MPKPLCVAAALALSAVAGLPVGAQSVAALQGADPAGTSLLDRPARLLLQGVTLEAALTRLSERSGVVVAFSPSLMQGAARRVSCDCATLTVGEALERLLSGTSFRYMVLDGQIVLTPERVPAAPVRPAQRLSHYAASDGAGPTVPFRGPLPLISPTRQQNSVSGTVLESGTQRPVEAAQVTAVGTDRIAVTDAAGRFRIDNLAGTEVTLRAERIGYRAVERSTRVGSSGVVLVLQESAITLDEVVVTGSIVESRVREMAVPVSVITAAEIERLGITGVDQLFRGRVPGVVSLEQGNIGWNTNVTVRGMNSFGVQSIKTYIDGVEMANPENVGMIDPSSIERIEVIRGPQAATLYGADAIGGVLQIFTKKGSATGLDRPRVTVRTTTGFVEGDYAPDSPVIDQRYSLQLDGGGAGFSYSAGVSHNREGEWVEGTRDRTSSVSAGLRATEGRFTAAATLRYVDRSYSFQTFAPFLAARFPQIPTFTLPPRPLDFQQQTMGTTLSYAALPGWTHSLVLGFDRAEFALTSGFDDPAAESGTIENRNQIRTSIRYHTSLEYALAERLMSTFTAGIDYWRYKTDMFSTSNAPSPELPDRVPVGEADLTLDRWRNIGYFGQVRLGFDDNLFVSAALRAEDNPNFGAGHGLAWAPHLGATYIHGFRGVEAKIRTAWGVAIRPPASPHRGGSTGGSIAPIQPNPNILPEEQSGWEAGVDLLIGDRASISATYFDQDVKNLIELVQDFGADPIFFQYQNLGSVKNRGWELEGVLDVAPVQLRGTFTTTRSRVTSLGEGYDGDLRVGDRNLDVPENTLGASITYGFWRGSAGAELSRVGSWTGFDVLAFYDFVFGGAPFRGSIQEYWTDYSPVTRLHLHAEQALTDRWDVSLRVQNLTNEQRGETLSSIAVARGRAILLGLRYAF